jgi:hypothetical protein
LVRENGLIMSSESSSVNISIAFTKNERDEAVEFIEKFMRETFECDPPPTHGIVCVARISGEVVGSIVLAGTEEHQPFPLERQYSFDPKYAPYPFVRHDMVQGSRWTSSRKDLPQVAIDLLRFSFSLAFGLGKRHMLIEAKPYSVKHLEKLGVICFPIEGAVIVVDSIKNIVGEKGMKYFIEPPLPTLYMIDIGLAVHAFQS